MGKKSRSKTGKRSKEGKKDGAANSCTADKRKLASTAPPAGASCYLCLDEHTPDAPLARDCACRGASGWAHLECLISYCAHKSRDAVEHPWTSEPVDGSVICGVWQYCQCCKQKHTNRLLLELSRAGLSFLADKYPGKEEKKLPGLSMVLDAVMLLQHAQHRDGDIKELGRTTAESIISLSGESHPTSQLAHIHLAQREVSKGTRPALRQAIHHWEQVKVCCSPDDAFARATADKQIKDMKISLGEEVQEDSTSTNLFGLDLELAKNMMLMEKERGGKDTTDTFDSIGSAKIFAMSLFGEGRGIEAERLLADTLRGSQRVLGSDHPDTKETERVLKLVRTRRVVILPISLDPNSRDMFEALEFNEATGAYVVRGPILEPRREEEESIRTVPMDLIVLAGLGTPVTCVGLKNAVHLNGKLGDAGRFVDLKTLRYPVKFEDEALETKCVKWENLRIAFDLTKTSKVEGDCNSEMRAQK